MKKNKISILVPDMSSNVVGAALNLARMLDWKYEVGIVGPDLGGGVNPMYVGAWNYTLVPCSHIYRLPEFWRDVKRLEEALDGDVIIAMKAYMDTLLPALRRKRSNGCSVVAYLDEWDGAQFLSWPWVERITHMATEWYHPLSDVYCWWAERYLKQVDLVISTTSYLQERFGGEIVPFGVDVEAFSMDDSAGQQLKRKWGLEQRFLIVFGGVAREHKGLGPLIEAIRRMKDRALCLLIAGPETALVRQWLDDPELHHCVCCTGAVARDEMPRYLNAGDVIAVPLSEGLLASSQMPCKVFEAMATGKTVIANDVSDLAVVVGDGGWVIPPDSVAAWEQVLNEIMQNPEEAKRRGALARERCRQRYDRKIIQKQLLKLVEPLMP